MSKYFHPQAIPIGLAMFSMFFGAGNIIFPLALGQTAGAHNFYAIIGLILTAAVMPIAGVIAMILYEGDYQRFFGRIGKVPGLILSTVIISLLGPLGSTPRCIALSYSTLQSSLIDIHPAVFSAIACGIVLVLSLNKTRLLSILGSFLTPFLLGSLALIIGLGIWNSPPLPETEHTPWEMFTLGVTEGYNTMDLLAAFFFSSTILHILQSRVHAGNIARKSYLTIAFQGSVLGAVLLATTYIGFSYLAALHGHHFADLGKDKLLAAITVEIAGAYGGALVCFTIVLACLTTAIALLSAFSDFVQKEVCGGKVSYKVILTLSTLATFLVSIFEFTGISSFLGPILEVVYPGLIALTVLNIAAYALTRSCSQTSLKG